jgi:hypothetical protein
MKPPLAVEKLCARCGRTFAPVRSNAQSYCSPACRQGAARCEQCGKGFIVAKRADGRFCSHLCHGAAMRQEMARTCGSCGVVFHAKRAEQRFCSAACRHFSLRRPRGECLRCKNPIPFKYGVPRRYCSLHCANSAKSFKKWDGRSNAPDGTRSASGGGYVKLKVLGEWKTEHRYVMEQTIGRPLAADERVHHRNGRRDDNRPENLELWHVKQKDPAGIRATDYHCTGCRCFD